MGPGLDQTAVSGRRRDVQGLRAIAVVLVIVFHAGLPVKGGFVGVDVFFAISGYVIAGSLIRELERDRRVNLPAFYRRRVKRLLPALGLMLTVVAVAGILVAPAAAVHMSALTGVFASVFAANLYLGHLPHGYFDIDTQLNPLLHTWTLAVEEQFYVVFPAVLYMAWRLRGRRAAGAAVGILGLASLAAAAVTHGSFAYYGSPMRAWEFAGGVLLALASPALARAPGLLAAAAGAVGAALLAVSAIAASGTQPAIVAAATPITAACLLIAAGTVRIENPISQLLSLRPFTSVGDMSYSLYLWHWPLIVFARATFPTFQHAAVWAAVLSLMPAWLSYRFVENPVRRNPRIRGRLVVAGAAVCVAVPIAVAIPAAQARLAHRADISLRFGSGEHLDNVNGCDRLASYASVTPKCVWQVRSTRGLVVLVGDSNAGHFTEPFVRAATREGWTAAVATKADCPFLLGLSGTVRGCDRFVRDSLVALQQQHPALVVVSNRADIWVNHDEAQLLATTVRSLNQEGIRVVVVHPVPRLLVTQYDCSALAILVGNCRSETARATADAALEPTLHAERMALRGAEARLVSFEDLLCSRTECNGERNGVSLYFDADHLSIAGALLLTDAFEDRVISYAANAPSRSQLAPDPVPSSAIVNP